MLSQITEGVSVSCETMMSIEATVGLNKSAAGLARAAEALFGHHPASDKNTVIKDCKILETHGQLVETMHEINSFPNIPAFVLADKKDDACIRRLLAQMAELQCSCWSLSTPKSHPEPSLAAQPDCCRATEGSRCSDLGGVAPSQTHEARSSQRSIMEGRVANRGRPALGQPCQSSSSPLVCAGCREEAAVVSEEVEVVPGLAQGVIQPCDWRFEVLTSIPPKSLSRKLQQELLLSHAKKEVGVFLASSLVSFIGLLCLPVPLPVVHKDEGDAK